MMTPKVALVSGFWAQNIGNAFFNIGGKYVLDRVFGKEMVQFVHDRPSYRTFYDQSKGDPNNYVGIHELLDIDYLVLQGPMLTQNFSSIWGNVFEKLKRNNVKIILLGASFFKFTNEEISAVHEFMERFPPDIVSTRDTRAYEILKEWDIPFVHDGIDSAFFVPKVFSPLSYRENYVTFCFDRFPEPNIVACDSNAGFYFNGERFCFSSPLIQNYFSKRGKMSAYFGHLFDFRKLPNNLHGSKIIRPEHRYVPHMTQKIYQHPNAIVSDEAFTYFSLYARTQLTLSDRVHACVMTLAYGNKAMLFTPSPRQALFARLGLDDIRNKPVSLDLDYLEEERESVIEFLKQAVQKLS